LINRNYNFASEDRTEVYEIMVKTYYIFALLFFPFLLQAQHQEVELINFSGRLLSADEGRAVPFAHVINLNKRQVTVSDTLGYFWLPVRRADTIAITSIGYETGYFCLYDTVTSEDFFAKIYLIRKAYSLQEIDILGISWREFKHQIVHMDDPDEIKQYAEMVAVKFTEWELADIQAAQPIGIPIALKSRQDRSRELLKLIEKEDRLDRAYDKKMNILISHYTGFKDTELIEFIKYCNLSRDFVLNSTEYVILTEIRQKLNNYSEGN